MRRRVTRPVAVVVAALVLGACAGDTEPAATTALERRKVTVGEVTVTVTPQRVAADGAVFAVALDTHSVDLDLDIADNARLTVDGVEWTGATWDGAASGGHHREGRVRFTGGTRPVTGEVVLSLDGLDEPVVARWTLDTRR